MNQALLAQDPLLFDANFIWEAMSVDGVSYPFSTERIFLNEVQRKSLIKKVNAFDNELAMAIAEAVLAGDDAELGRIVREQITAHVELVRNA